LCDPEIPDSARIARDDAVTEIEAKQIHVRAVVSTIIDA
jgi:hypothetical protein